MTYLAVFTLMQSIVGWACYGYIRGRLDAGDYPIIIRPWLVLVWAVIWLALTLTEIGWL